MSPAPFFVEGPRDRDELRRIGRELLGPLAVNSSKAAGALCSWEELVEMGFFSGFRLPACMPPPEPWNTPFTPEIRPTGRRERIADALMPFDEFNALSRTGAPIRRGREVQG
jgi:hypothetical protein